VRGRALSSTGRLLGVLVGWLIVTAVAAADEIRIPPHSKPSIRVNSELVLVPVIVTDRRGAPVTGLQEERFRVFDEQQPQQIVSFSVEDAPCSVGLILDISGSMGGGLANAYPAVRRFTEAARTDDEVFLMTFAGQPRLETGFSSDFEDLENRVRSAKPRGWTALFDAVYLALDRMKAARHRRKALIVVSDGIDNRSRYSRRELLARAVESDVQIHNIAVDATTAGAKVIELHEQRRGLLFLQDLAGRTGGLHFVVRTPREAGAAMEEMAKVLHSQYLIGYHPPDRENRSWRRIRVKLDVSDLRVYARGGYFPSGAE
jgi:Ca-activated chloride channel family protein